ncbi:MAG: hypothetical protein CBC24_03410 [Candidatus Pelagibacter sp. TMED64]|nr:glycosyltransferase family 1 protein [Candidatus Pelagibacter sp.]OUU66390.1 MAG: hypothetical protein CBC24_03410 [Candidatus Pelagibacter sp. TMED64]|tara:strand:+ start:15870 stop:17051 length:1182 start_codon:yes stop_codon:yes gene_type:complete
MNLEERKKKIIYIINDLSFFVSHRLPLALHAKSKKWNVKILIGKPGSKIMEKHAKNLINQYDLDIKRINFSSSSLNIFSEIIGFLQIFFEIFLFKPNIVHLVSNKPILYGGIISRILNIPCLIVAISGMGAMFTGKKEGLMSLLPSIYLKFLKFILKHKNLKLILQNKDDNFFFIDNNLVNEKKITLIPGSGVDLNKYKNSSNFKNEKIILFPARILIDKGTIEFVESAKILKEKYPDWRFVLVGASGYKNPSSISETKINEWIDKGYIEWWGYKNEMSEIFMRSSIVCLPSYREGMPKSLLEAAAAGKPVITTDVTGCREAILAGVTGELVPVKNISKLVESLSKLIENRSLCEEYGKEGKLMAKEKFDIKNIVSKTFSLYESLLTKYEKKI